MQIKRQFVRGSSSVRHQGLVQQGIRHVHRETPDLHERCDSDSKTGEPAAVCRQSMNWSGAMERGAMHRMNGSRSMDVFTRQCRNNGLKITPQRIAIYDFLLKSNDHPSADHVYKSIRKKYPNISFDTVNRTLMTFADIGLIDLAESHIGVRRYDPNPDKHHHIHCIACGAIFDFTYGGYDRLDVPDEIANVFDILSKKIVLNAVCPECLKKSMLPPPAEPENAEAGGEESME